METTVGWVRPAATLWSSLSHSAWSTHSGSQRRYGCRHFGASRHLQSAVQHKNAVVLTLIHVLFLEILLYHEFLLDFAIIINNFGLFPEQRHLHAATRWAAEGYHRDADCKISTRNIVDFLRRYMTVQCLCAQAWRTYYQYHSDYVCADGKLKEAEKQEEKQKQSAAKKLERLIEKVNEYSLLLCFASLWCNFIFKFNEICLCRDKGKSRRPTWSAARPEMNIS